MSGDEGARRGKLYPQIAGIKFSIGNSNLSPRMAGMTQTEARIN